MTSSFSRPGSSDAFSETEPVVEETPSKAVERETATQAPEEDPTPLGEVPPEGLRRAEAPETREDEGLRDRARDYLLGEGRERDYLRGEER